MTHWKTGAFALAVTLFGLAGEAARGQPLNFSSAIRLGGTSNDEGEQVAVDAAGNVYVAGTHSGPIDFDTGPGTLTLGSGGPFNAFVAKYAPSGALLWARNQPPGVATSYSLTVDSAGNVYTAGWFSGTVDFDPGPGTVNITAVGAPNTYISKLDSNGNLVWAKGLLGGTTTSRDVAVDAAGNVYTSGYLWTGTIDFDPGAGTANLTNAGNQLFILKLDSSGNFVWVVEFAGTQALNGNGLALDAAGNVYATANFELTVDLDPGPGVATFTNTNRDPFVVKLTPAGTYVWAKQFAGGIGAGFGSDVAVDAAGNVHCTGYFIGTVDFDPGPATSTFTAAGSWDVYVAKLDTNGNFIWARRLGGAGDDEPNSITVDGAGNVYTTGYFDSTPADFDPGPSTFNLSSAGQDDIFVSLLDSAGNFVNAVRIGAANNDEGNHLAVSPSGVVYVIGTFELTADFDPGPGTNNLISAGLRDIFVIGLQGGSGGPPPPGPGPSPPPSPGTEGSSAGSGGGPSGGEGSYGFGGRMRRQVLAGPFVQGPGHALVLNVLPQQHATAAGEQPGGLPFWAIALAAVLVVLAAAMIGGLKPLLSSGAK